MSSLISVAIDTLGFSLLRSMSTAAPARRARVTSERYPTKMEGAFNPHANENSCLTLTSSNSIFLTQTSSFFLWAFPRLPHSE
jgi:hypothetical protein